jgi:hypothetical protein
MSLACTALVTLGLAGEAGAQSVQASPETFGARIAAAQAGQTIVLGPGSYGSLDINNRSFSGAGLVIEAASGAKAVFTSVRVNGSAGLTLKNVEIAMEPPAPNANIFGITIGSGSNHVNMVGLKVHGVAGGDNGMLLRDCGSVSVADSDFSQLGTGINFLDCDHVDILRNTLSDIQVDAIRGASSHVNVIGNHGTSFHPQPGDHPDFIQFWSPPQGGAPTGNVIKDNVYERGHGDPAQGIFIENNTDLVISGNALVGTQYNAISTSGVQRAVIEDNFIQNYPDMTTWIITRSPSTDIVVRNNITPAVKNQIDNGQPNKAYKEQGNKSIRAAKPGDGSALQAWLAQRQQH